MAQIGNWDKPIDQNLDERESWKEPLEKWVHPEGPKCYFFKEDGPDGSGKYWVVWETANGEEYRLTRTSRQDYARRSCTTLRQKYSNSPNNNRIEPVPIGNSD